MASALPMRFMRVASASVMSGGVDGDNTALPGWSVLPCTPGAVAGAVPWGEVVVVVVVVVCFWLGSAANARAGTSASAVVINSGLRIWNLDMASPFAGSLDQRMK